MSESIQSLLTDFPAYIGAFWKVIDKTGREIRWVPSAAQRVLNDVLRRQLRERGSVRMRVLKYRQAMVSTWSTALMQWLTSTSLGCTAISIADKMDLPMQWLRRCKRWHMQTPEGTTIDGVRYILRPRLGASNAIEMYFDEMGSRFHIASAEGTTPGMGATIRGVHCSEIASWHAPDALLNDLLPAMPPGAGTYIVQESTGRARGDWWYKRYFGAKRGEEGYESIFLPWYIERAYSTDAADIIAVNEYERWLVTKGVLPGQLAWRRRQIRDEFHGDEAAFANQFPATEEEAFLAAGANRFTPDHVARARKTIRLPVWRGDIFVGERVDDFRLVGNESGPLLIWDHDPRKGQVPAGRWGIGADCRDAGEDFDAAYSEQCFTGKVGFGLHGRWDTGTWAKMLGALGLYYNRAKLANERNHSSGKATTWSLLGLAGNNWKYPNLYIRRQERGWGAVTPEDYCWWTDHNSKALLIATTMESLDAQGQDWPDVGSVEELESIIVPEDGNPRAPDGQHDDRWMARMIATQAARMEASENPQPMAPTPPGNPWRTNEDRLAEQLAPVGDDDPEQQLMS